MRRWIVILTLFVSTTRADTTRPAYLEVIETSPGVVDVVWKLPKQPGVITKLWPTLPDSFSPSSAVEVMETPAATTKKWSMIGEPLPGATIRIEGLNTTALEALVRVELSNGATLRAVLRPTAPQMTLPRAEAPKKAMPTAPWIYATLFLAAAGLSLTPSARQRGVLWCSLALVAGSIAGDALGAAWPKSAPQLDKEAAGRVIEGLMLNTYRAFIFEVDEDVYAVLERSVDGAALNAIYLENRDRLTFNDEESAGSLVDRLDVTSIESMKWNKDGSVTLLTDWDVYGTVFHWEHAHFRCNAFTAEITISPVADYWKISRLEVLTEERVL